MFLSEMYLISRCMYVVLVDVYKQHKMEILRPK